MAVMKDVLKTTGMHCRSCSTLVDLTVGDLPGVEQVETDLESGRTTVEYDPDAVSVEEILTSIRSIGYDAERT